MNNNNTIYGMATGQEPGRKGQGSFNTFNSSMVSCGYFCSGAIWGKKNSFIYKPLSDQECGR